MNVLYKNHSVGHKLSPQSRPKFPSLPFGCSSDGGWCLLASLCRAGSSETCSYYCSLVCGCGGPILLSYTLLRAYLFKYPSLLGCTRKPQEPSQSYMTAPDGEPAGPVIRGPSPAECWNAFQRQVSDCSRQPWAGAVEMVLQAALLGPAHFLWGQLLSQAPVATFWKAATSQDKRVVWETLQNQTQDTLLWLAQAFCYPRCKPEKWWLEKPLSLSVRGHASQERRLNPL